MTMPAQLETVNISDTVALIFEQFDLLGVSSDNYLTYWRSAERREAVAEFAQAIKEVHDQRVIDRVRLVGTVTLDGTWGEPELYELVEHLGGQYRSET